MAVTPLSVCFGDAAALICCEESSLYETLAHHLRHCRPAPVTPSVTYTIRPVADCLALYRNATQLYYGPSAAYIVERLLHDLALTLARYCRQHMVFHAAALAWGERGLLLCGESGSGKSTLAACLIASGFDYLTDEMVAFSTEATMSGLARPILLKAGSEFIWQQWLGPPGPDSLAHFADGSRLLDPACLGGGQVRASAIPRLLLFPRYAAGQPFQAQPLPAATAAFHLMHRLLNAENLPDRGFSVTTELARQTAAYSLVYGDARAVVEWLRETATTENNTAALP